jgi:CBS domain-containing protein
MKVKDIMTTDLKTCTPDTTVAEAGALMWDGDCGFLPVVDDGVLVGVVTDRDMYIALATQNARASRLRVGAVASTKLATCAPEDEMLTALATMKQARVRRLPVVGFFLPLPEADIHVDDSLHSLPHRLLGSVTRCAPLGRCGGGAAS